MLHSNPYVSNLGYDSEEVTLRKGMVLAIEPMFIDGESNHTTISNDGWSVIASGLCAHFEHTIVVDDDPIILTQGD